MSKFWKNKLIYLCVFTLVFAAAHVLPQNHSVIAYTQKHGTVTGNAVNIRSGAGTSHNVIAQLNKGNQVDVIGESTATNGALWYKIQFLYSNALTTGYIHSDYLKVVSIQNSDSTDHSSTDYEKKTGYVNGDHVNIRNGAGTSNDKICQLSTGAEVTVVGEAPADNGLLWYKIEFTYSGEQKTGYIHSTYLSLTKPTDTNTDTDSNTSTSTNTNTDTTYYEVEKQGYVTGDEVRVRNGAGTSNTEICKLKLGTELTVLGEATASNGVIWYKIRFDLNGTQTEGFMHSDYVRVVIKVPEGTADPDYEKYLEAQGFPESYRVYLRALHNEHPNWTFVAVPTGLQWSTVVEKESELGRNLIPSSGITSYKSLEPGAYNWDTGKWIGFDSSSWVAASRSIIKHYLDPRNFLYEGNYILQFETLKYVEGEQTLEGIANVLDGTFMATDNYYRIFMEAGKESGVNPYHLAARCRQEVSSKGSNSTFDVKDEEYSEFDGYYNFFNIGASPSAAHNSMYNGLAYAKAQGWDSPEKAIKGGAKFVAEGYINKEQDTLYFQKFDVVDGGNGLYSHQYMTNLQAAASESSQMKRAYPEWKDTVITYRIPVYLNMPDEAIEKLIYDGSAYCVLSSIHIAGYEFTEEFDGYQTSYKVKETVKTDTITIDATAYGPNVTIEGLGNVKLTKGTNQLTVKATGKDGSQLTYNITVECDIQIEPTLGDVTGDGKINVQDASMILKAVVGKLVLTEEQNLLGDVDKNGIVDVSDALKILKYVSGEITF